MTRAKERLVITGTVRDIGKTVSTGQASAPILHLTILQRPVFLINSRLGLFTAADLRSAPLLPKLRGHFAEFLNESSLAHLRILSSTTCVGLRYGSLFSH